MRNVIDQAIFNSRLEAVCEEMGVTLMRSAFSANIKDRLDFSCAVFDTEGRLCAQAAHIPVHLGSMTYTMTEVVEGIRWRTGDVVVYNDPFLGGTHLPDVTLIAPVFVADELMGFVANRAHHANIGSSSPGSMPISRSITEEGVVIAPVKLLESGRSNPEAFRQLSKIEQPESCHEGLPLDFWAQLSACQIGIKRLGEMIESLGKQAYEEQLEALFDYADRLSTSVVEALDEGEYRFTDFMEGDGLIESDIPLCLTLRVSKQKLEFNFTGTASQVAGNINCPVSVTAAAIYYVYKCLLPPEAPTCAGAFSKLEITAPSGCLVNARYPAAVAAGNVETSSRLVDLVLGAISEILPGQIPAASQGTMNNIAIGAHGKKFSWNYYETIGGGAGASPLHAGNSAVQTHMTNTLNTPIESLELQYPLKIRRYQIATETGGAGLHQGGNGILREFEFEDAAEVTILSERRRHGAYGLQGGNAGKPGQNYLNGKPLGGKVALSVKSGDVLRIQTPGGGGWGDPAG